MNHSVYKILENQMIEIDKNGESSTVINLSPSDNIPLLKKLCYVLTKHHAKIDCEVYPGGDYFYYLNDDAFIKKYGKSYRCCVKGECYTKTAFIEHCGFVYNNVKKIIDHYKNEAPNSIKN